MTSTISASKVKANEFVFVEKWNFCFKERFENFVTELKADAEKSRYSLYETAELAKKILMEAASLVNFKIICFESITNSTKGNPIIVGICAATDENDPY